MSNAGNENGLQRLEVIRKLNGENREWDNSELYRLHVQAGFIHPGIRAY